MSSVIGGPSSQELVSTTRPYRKAPMTTALPSYTTSRDITFSSPTPQMEKIAFETVLGVK